jgi:hypothetical protein
VTAKALDAVAASLDTLRLSRPRRIEVNPAAGQARPATSSSSRRPYHQLISAPKTIAFAIT